jgi:hypothetical protein
MNTLISSFICLTLGYIIGSFIPFSHNRDKVKASPGEAYELIETAEAITISDLSDHTITLTDKKLFSEIRSYLYQMDVKKDMLKLGFKYKIHLYSRGSLVSFRITENGMILSDVPASQIQDGYVPSKQGIVDLLQALLDHSK